MRIRNNTASGGVGGRIVAGLFFAVFLGMGLFFCGLVLLGVYDAVKTRFWQPTKCVITRSEVGNSRSGEYQVDIAFEYEFYEQSYSSESYELQEQTEQDYQDVAAVVEKYPVGSTAICYVNGNAPSEAVLAHGSPWFVFFIVVPLVFVAIGGFGLYAAVFNRTKTEDEAKARKSVAKSAKGGSGRAGGVFMVVFGGLFLAVGLGLCFFLGVWPLIKVAAAGGWIETPCKIISSRVTSSSDGDTYRVDVLYEYEYEGVTRRSNRYAFVVGYSSGYDSKQAVVKQYPAGSESVCYVNPHHPAEAVLERGLVGGYLWGLFGLPFALAGGWIVFSTFRSRRSRTRTAALIQRKTRVAAKEASSAAMGWLPDLPAEETSPVVLRAVSGRWAKFGGVLAACLFWNGIVSVFVREAVGSWADGDGEIGLTIFLIPFVLIGLGLIGGVFYYLLALTNPRPHLTVSRQIVPVGGSFDLEWHFSHRARSFSNVEFVLLGREEATYKHGTSTSTDKKTFCEVTLASVERPVPYDVGRVTVKLPGNVMHSFESENNKIVWRILMRGKIARWPDVKDEFAIVVLPAEYV